MNDEGRTHFVGDDCLGGHREDASEAQLRWMVAGARRCPKGCMGPCQHSVGREFVLPDSVRVPCKGHKVYYPPDRRSYPVPCEGEGCPGWTPTTDRWAYLEATESLDWNTHLILEGVFPSRFSARIQDLEGSWQGVGYSDRLAMAWLRALTQALVSWGATLGRMP